MSASLFSGNVLLAQENGPWMVLVIIVVLVVMALVSFVLLLARQYKRCPSNKVLVIFGIISSRVSGFCSYFCMCSRPPS